MTLSKDDELLLNAYLDGELDSLEASRFEARLASEPALAADIEAYRLLRRRSAPISLKMRRHLISGAALHPASTYALRVGPLLGVRWRPPSSQARCLLGR
jgi:anti-sigma factor RsiW